MHYRDLRDFLNQLERRGQLRGLPPVAPPLLSQLPDFVTVGLRRTEQLLSTRLLLNQRISQGTGIVSVTLPFHQTEIGREELALRRCQLADGSLESCPRAAGPDQDRDQAVDQNAQAGLLRP